MARIGLVTLVVAEYDELAIGAVRTLRRASIAVPGRLSVVGLDNHEMAWVVDLTSVAQPVQEQGSVAARLLLDCLDESKGTAPTEVVLPLRGVSAVDVEGGPFRDAEADAALFGALTAGLRDSAVTVREVDAAINDPGFGTAAADTLHRLITGSTGTDGTGSTAAAPGQA